VEAIRPISRFIPDQYAGEDVDIVIGVEIDQPEFSAHKILGKKCASFCQWTFMAKPGLPIMLKLVEKIIRWLNEESRRQNVEISMLKLDFNGILSGTGVRLWY
jgi:mannosyltransferase OCH1-like enzyme